MSKLSKEKKDEIKLISIEVARQFKDKYEISNLLNPFEVISKLEDIIIVRFPANDKLSGFTMKKGDYKCIYVNSSHILCRQYSTCWHEFYHAINDVEDICIDDNNKEDIEDREAQYFASCIMMPEQEVKNFIIKNNKKFKELDLEFLIQMQYHFGVSLSSLFSKLSELNIGNFYKYKYITDIDNIDVYNNLIENLGFKLDLVKATNDYVVDKSFFEDLYKNIINKKISFGKGKELGKFIESKGVKGGWS